MNLLLAGQGNEGLTVLGIRKVNEWLSIKARKNDSMRGHSFIQSILSFSFRQKHYIALAKKSGMVQLFESGNINNARKNFKLYKEWKQSNLGNSDCLIAMEFINQRYLLTCSAKGKLILRDLVNDDADSSYNVYLIDRPVSCIEVNLSSSGNVLVLAAGMNNLPKIYEVELNQSKLSKDIAESTNNEVKPLHETGGDYGIELSPQFPDSSMSLRRRFASFNVNFSYDRSYIHHLVPKWEAEILKDVTSGKEEKYSRPENWITSILRVQSNENVLVASTQYGDLVVYDCDLNSKPSKVLSLSKFPVIKLHAINNGQYIFFIDLMSRAGIIKVSNFSICILYPDLRLGPIAFCKIVSNESVRCSKRKINKNSDLVSFDPIYLLCSSIDQRISIIKLYDEAFYESICRVQADIMVPYMEILNSATVYEDFEKLTTTEGLAFISKKSRRKD